MDTPSHVELIRLHCAHLHSLIAHVTQELATIERVLTPTGAPPPVWVAPQLKALEEQSEQIVTELLRLQGFVHSLLLASEGAGPMVDE